MEQIRKQTKILRIYSNNYYGGKAVVNAMQSLKMCLRTSYDIVCEPSLELKFLIKPLIERRVAHISTIYDNDIIISSKRNQKIV